MSKICDGSSDEEVDGHGHVNLDGGPQTLGRHLLIDPSEETS
jgi:hypothetical protein